jgi:PAS domain S-box-containing protein
MWLMSMILSRSITLSVHLIPVCPALSINFNSLELLQSKMVSPQTFSEILATGFREAVVILSRDLKIMSANEAFLQDNNVSLQEIEGRTCHEVLRSCMNFCKEQTDECPVHEALSTRKPVSVTHQDVLVDTIPHHYKIDIYPVFGAGEAETYFLHIARDITNRIEEERLKDNMWMEILSRMESLYAAMVAGNENIETIRGEIDQLIEIVPLAVVGWDSQGKITRWNSNAEILFGRPAVEVFGKPFLDFFASGKSQKRFSDIMHMMHMGQTEVYSLAENRTASGHILSCEWYHNVYKFDDKGEMSVCLSLGQDATGRLATEKKVEKLETQLEAILNATGDAIVGLNNLRRITLWNPAAEKLFGWLAREVQGREIEMLIPADLREIQAQKFHRFLEGQGQKKSQKITFQTSALRRDSIIIPVEITLSSALIEDSLSGFAVFHEITERKRTEKILLQSEKMRTLGEMASGVAHDFNNSLTTILGNIKLLKETGVDREAAEKLDAIEKAARQGAETIASLQGLSLTADDAAHKGIELVVLEPLIEEVRNLTRFRWKDLPQKEGYTIDFTTEIEGSPALQTNGSDFKEMLTNLIFNAVDAMPRGGHIHISVKQHEDKISLVVQDNGAGMSREDAAHIFDPYFTTKGRGHAGLGLSIARRFVERHGGSITVESIKGAGSTFRIEFPLGATSDPEKMSQAKKPLPPTQLQILVIDDEPLVRRLLRQALENRGHSVTEAGNGQEGVRCFREKDIDLVITDHGMPVMNGLEAAFRIKKQKPGTPVLLITGWQTQTDSIFQKPSSIDEFISKPFDLEKIFALVEKYGRKVKPVEPQ